MVKNYRATFDFASHGMLVDEVRSGSSTAGFYARDDRTIQFVSGDYSWNEAQSSTAGETSAKAPIAVPQPGWLLDRQLLAWAGTPQGVLKAAAGASVHNVIGGTELNFTVGRYPAKAFLNQLHQLERLETLTSDVVLGDVSVVIRYTGYRDFGGIRFPGLIVESENGVSVLSLAVTAVEINPAVSISVPANIRAYLPPPVIVKTQKLADGVYWITGGSHHSMAVDMGGYVVMVEAPVDEARSEAVIAATKTLFPGKPIRYVINTHAHFDHAGGLRTYVDQGATVVTQELNRAFYERAWASPRTLEPDKLAKSRKRAKFMVVQDSATLKGANSRTVELHLLQGNPHNEQNLLVWLPAERILFQADMINGAVIATSSPSPVVVNFYDNLQRLNIQPVQIVGGHGAAVLSMADLNTVSGRTPTN
jgi:glyoxylase-like metal-dependent hydrolase (beta-lactamase superfamily II)